MAAVRGKLCGITCLFMFYYGSWQIRAGCLPPPACGAGDVPHRPNWPEPAQWLCKGLVCSTQPRVATLTFLAGGCQSCCAALRSE